MSFLSCFKLFYLFQSTNIFIKTENSQALVWQESREREGRGKEDNK
jgi:hypothetical protein